jgi:hypothetical protein
MENLPDANPGDVESIDAIIKAAYDVISGPAGKERDWDRERSLFWPDARLIPTSRAAGAVAGGKELSPQLLDVEGYIKRSRVFLEQTGFYEQEITRRTEQFGHIAQVWSTYESRHSLEDAQPFMRGINSIQLFFDGRRWWILSIYWQHETAADPLPPKYVEGESVR